MLTILLLAKVLRDYRAQVTSVILFSNPVSNLIRQMAQLVATDLQSLNQVVKNLLFSTDNSKMQRLRGRAIVSMNLLFVVAFIWKLIDIVKQTLRKDSENRMKTAQKEQSKVRRPVPRANSYQQLGKPLHDSSCPVGTMSMPKPKRVFRNNLAHKAKSLLEISKINQSLSCRKMSIPNLVCTPMLNKSKLTRNLSSLSSLQIVNECDNELIEND